MSIRPLSVLLCAAVLAGCSPQTDATEGEMEEAPADYAPQPLTAAHLANLIAADGARHTVLVLTGPADPTGIDKVFAGFATADPDWLALVPVIEPEVQGETALALQQALATALPHNASGVLALVPDHTSLPVVCKPDVDAAAARAAVDAITDPGLQAAKAECLRYLGTG